MLKRLLERPVELQVGAGHLRFKSSKELEYALSGKTAVSSGRVAALGRLDDPALARESDGYQLMEQRIVGALSQPGNGIDPFLVQLDLEEISEDHDWRAIFAALRTLDGPGESYKKTALLKYVEYLTSGQEVVRTIRANRFGGAMPSRPRPASDSAGGSPTRQDLIFDLEELSGTDQAGSLRSNDNFARLLKGETLEIQFGPHQSLAMVLAKYRFTLVSGDPYLLLDETGHDVKVRPGKNIVGRSSQSDIVIDGTYGAISRKHLIIEIDGSGGVKLTDISTLGTFVPKDYIDNKLH